MSREKLAYEARRWLRTAEEDLMAARDLQKTEHHAQACFFSQQAGEKAVKGLWYFVDGDPRGHSVQKLILEFPDDGLSAQLQPLLDAGASLDKYYIPTRYPNGLPDLTPGQSYSAKDSDIAIGAARSICDTVGHLLQSSVLDK